MLRCKEGTIKKVNINKENINILKNIKIRKVIKKRPVLKYNLNIQGNKRCKGNEGSIKKNVKHMTDAEKQYIKKAIKDIKDLDITHHALEKELINKEQVIDIISNKQYKIIDFNYYPHNHEERVVIRTKKKEKVLDSSSGKIEDSYIKVVISLTTFVIISCWSNRVKDETMKNNNLGERYMEKFDIINKKVKF